VGDDGQPLVAEVDKAAGHRAPTPPEACVSLPALLTQVRSAGALAEELLSRAAAPSPLLRFHLLDLLFGYAYVARTYNGCWRADPPQACDGLLAVSAVLGQPTRPPRLQSASMALSGSLAALAEREQAGPGLSAMGLALAGDVAAMLAHKARVLCALADAFNVLRAALAEVIGGGEGGLGESL
jgi:hypothetical protein